MSKRAWSTHARPSLVEHDNACANMDSSTPVAPATHGGPPRSRLAHTKRRRHAMPTDKENQMWAAVGTEITATTSPASGDASNDASCTAPLTVEAPVTNVCTSCKSHLVHTEDGYMMCVNSECAQLFSGEISMSAEWRYFGNEEHMSQDPSRVGPSRSNNPMNAATTNSAYMCKLQCNGGMSHNMWLIKRFSTWQSTSHREKTQNHDFRTIMTMAYNAGIPKLIIDQAIYYYRLISNHEMANFRGENRDGIIAASIYIAARVNNSPRAPKEIAAIFHLDVSSATRGCRNAMSILNEMETNVDVQEKTTYCTTTPESFIDRYCSHLHINQELTQFCMFLSMKVRPFKTIMENTPPSIAAGIVYYVIQLCRLNITKKEVKAVSLSSEVTINKCFKKIEQIASSNHLVPTAILTKYSLNDMKNQDDGGGANAVAAIPAMPEVYLGRVRATAPPARSGPITAH